jgi:hypothetical protein
MLKRKFFGPRTMFTPPASAGSGFFGTTGTSFRLTVYDAVTDVVSLSATALPQQPGADVAFGNSTAGVYTRASNTTTTYKYTWSTNAVTTGGALFSTLTSSSGWGMGNDVKGFYGLGNGATTAAKYTYATDVNIQITGTSVNTVTSSACGNITDGIVVLNNATANTNHWVYSTEVRNNGTAMSYGSSTTGGSTVGDGTRGIFVKNNTAATSKYTWAAATSVAATSLLGNVTARQGTSDSTTGLFVLGGSTTATNKYTFSGDTVAVGTALTVSQSGGAPGLSSSNPGVNV